MAVLNTTSPTVCPSAPMDSPRKMLPSARASMAGVVKRPPVNLPGAYAGAKKRDDCLRVIPLFLSWSCCVTLVDTLKRESYRNAHFGSTANHVCAHQPMRGPSAQPQHILHVIQGRRLLAQPQCRAHRAAGEGHATGGLVGDFHPFALGGEQHGVVAHHVAGTHGGEADGFPRAGAGLAFAP